MSFIGEDCLSIEKRLSNCINDIIKASKVVPASEILNSTGP